MGMTHDLSGFGLHPSGEPSAVANQGPPRGVLVDSFTGPVHVEWDREAAFTPLGQLPFFIDFLKTAGLFDAFVADCPLHYTSPNAPKKRDVLGTAMLAMLAGHKRYAHIAALRGDEVLPELVGMSRIVSEDAVRRAFATNWVSPSLPRCPGVARTRWLDDGVVGRGSNGEGLLGEAMKEQPAGL